jgi:sulfite oxidase
VTDGVALDEILLNAVILVPPDGAALSPGPVVIRGWAIGPHGTAPSRVEVSVDGGATWYEAGIEATEERWIWRLWAARMQLGPGDHELVVRAWDQEGRGQPASVEETWNVKGYANNAWHRARVTVRA